MTMVGELRRAVLARSISERSDLIGSASSSATGSASLDQWNECWARIAETIPYYRDLLRKGTVPPGFCSWEEFAACMPETSRSVVQENAADMMSRERRAEFYRVSGGSTGEPIRMPAWRSEIAFTLVDTWVGRGWYGVTPASRAFLIWGHSHLFGRGPRRLLAWGSRSVKDWLIGTERFPAYNLGVAPLRRAADRLLAGKHDFVVGYSVALDAFARANEDRRDALRGLGIRVVIGTAEAFPFPDSADRLRDLFGCPVAMEYGAVETNVIAYTRPSGGYTLFHASYHAEALPTDGDGRHRLHVTSLYPRCFPLVRYDLGDEIVLGDDSANPSDIRTFERVRGRCNDLVRLSDGVCVHSEAFAHAIVREPCIHRFQVRWDDCNVTVAYVGDRELMESEIHSLQTCLGTVNPELAQTRFLRVAEMPRTLSGKQPPVVCRWPSDRDAANPMASSSAAGSGGP